jgi:general secretion pathway protein D
VRTQLTIYDGETVVMGGTIWDTSTTTDDRIPVIGDLPLIGRAFRSKTEVKDKRNLLIFVSARLVNPDGSPIREREVRGLPPFRR